MEITACNYNSFVEIVKFSLSSVVATIIISTSLVVSTQISGYNEINLKNPLDKSTCKCDCWDGFYRGIFPKMSNGTEYKVFYFNYDRQIVLIIFLFLTYGELLRKCVVKILKSVQSYKILKIRWFLLVNLIVSIYSNYYGAWCLINYLNDRDYRMINSQIFFSLSELVISYIYFKKLNRLSKNKNFNSISLNEACLILSLCFLHIYLAIGEKILWGFFVTDPSANRNKIRDINLIIGDILGIILGYLLLMKFYQKKGTRAPSQYEFRKSFKLFSALILVLYCFYKFLCDFSRKN
ncbi:unnamed protein product [Brachionus calyciflorus]|uniref:Uncharacterized protein n=1 Tax=Brachionus calyciflorus TaxID=104777 RepID=A0A813TKE2_9BILA|nr:unnamed protein product [Brachionus calyciflorus]